MATTFKGVDAAAKSLKKLTEKHKDIFAIALYRTIQETELREVKVATPIDEGPLRASIKLSQPVRSGRKVSLDISADTDYAQRVHDDLEMEHKAPTRSRYIAGPLEENAGTLPARTAAMIEVVRKEEL